jgi:hypothetical protein
MPPHITRFVLTALALVGFASTAQAALLLGEISYSAAECDSMGCEGSSLYLKVEDTADYVAYSTGYIVTYTIDTGSVLNQPGYTGSKTGFNQIGFKVIKDWDLAGNNEVISSPTDPADDWNPVFDDPISSGSECDTNTGDTDKVCLNGFVNIVDTPGEYTWVVYIEEGTLMDVGEWHLGAQYANSRYRTYGGRDSTNKNGNIISTQPVPEPTAAVLFGLGAILVARRAGRR